MTIYELEARDPEAAQLVRIIVAAYEAEAQAAQVYIRILEERLLEYSGL